ncbi:hypothetical protein [Virgibacillus halodenitrificans]|uniref:hypothetical protein n=1 Tax=Virgibacillus halodenitrificans TaxID=1482 RepID=UPI000984ADEB|nr:hypothetical protein [Virgibacillus halodenitrificans]
MNWPVLKDKKWWISFLFTLLLSITAILLAAFENEYWVLPLILSISVSAIGIKRATTLTYKTGSKHVRSVEL